MENTMISRRLCPICRDMEVEMKSLKTMYLLGGMNPYLMGTAESMEVEMYLCPRCRNVQMFAPVTPLEEFEAMPEFRNDVERFEWTFKDYSDKKLQKVIEGKSYVEDAKRAARNLLMRRKYDE